MDAILDFPRTNKERYLPDILQWPGCYAHGMPQKEILPLNAAITCGEANEDDANWLSICTQAEVEYGARRRLMIGNKRF